MPLFKKRGAFFKGLGCRVCCLKKSKKGGKNKVIETSISESEHVIMLKNVNSMADLADTGNCEKKNQTPPCQLKGILVILDFNNFKNKF